MLITVRPRLEQQLAFPRSPRKSAAPARSQPVSPLSLVVPACQTCQGTQEVQEAGKGTGALARATGGSGKKAVVGTMSSSGVAATTTNPSNSGTSLNNGLDNKGVINTTGMQGAVSLPIVHEARPITMGASGATIGIMTLQHRRDNSDRIPLAPARGPRR